MKHPIFAFLFTVLMVALGAPAAMAQAPEQGSPSANLQNLARNSFIFRFDDSVSPGQARGRAAALVSQAGGGLGHVYSNTIKGFSASMTSVAADNLFRRNAEVVGYTRDGIASIVQASPTKGKPLNKPNSSGPAPQATPWGITRVGGGESGAGTGKRACVIDTGVDLDNPDLNIAISGHASFVTSGKASNSPDDYQGHGTHVAGTIAAKNNAIDVVGVAAGAEVVSIRVLDQRGSGLWSWVIKGIDYSASSAANCYVANLSLGGGGNNSVDDAVEAAAAKGVKFAIAAGNSGSDVGSYSPARAEHANIYTVSAVDKNDVFAYFSNYGDEVDYAAPGVSVLSLKKGGGVTTKSGTSMAAPHVAGILLLGSVKSNSTAIDDPAAPDDPIAHR